MQKKKMKRKILTIALILILILPYVMVNTSHGAGEDVTFSLNSQNAQKGEVIIEGISMNCTNNFSAANLVLTYDSNVLEYIPYTSGNEVDYTQNCGPTILNNGVPTATVMINSNNPGTLKIGYMSQTSVAGKSGLFLMFRFKVKENAELGNSDVSLSATTLKNANGEDLSATFVPAQIGVLSSISMSNSTLSLEPGETDQLSVSSPDSTIFGEVTWTSSDTSVATVTASSDSRIATVTANQAGTATITATVNGLTTTTTVTVTAPAPSYTISIDTPAWTSLPATQVRTLSASFNPSSASAGKTLTWSSSNTSVATINATTGQVTAVGNGTTTITVTDGVKSATYTLTVAGMLGNIGDDTIITSYDAYRALKLSTDQNSGLTVDQNEVVLLDVERNGDISANDAYLILKHSIGLISSFN